ncbi:MAG: NAD(+)/NADH kinase [Acidobacteria bacterium]|nr:NAD(+)/NADH kinase [Acidobacteriota bacterium]HNU01441.1 NAD(+)/NADH kinase [Acidobacteriota bacterium]
MCPTIAVFGGAFNPPGQHHRAIAEALSRQFDRVVVVPSGPRPDKPSMQDVEPIHRAAMADMAFRGLANVRVDLFDLEEGTFTRNHDLETRYAAEGEVWHVVGGDLVGGGSAGRSFIQTRWSRGEALWQELRFAVFTRPGHPLIPLDRPPRSRLFDLNLAGSSADVRERLFRHEPVTDRLDPRVAEYIDRYGLYRGRPPVRTAPLRLDPPRPLLVVDESNPQAGELAARLAGTEPASPPNCILVVGGDGTMLHAIRRHWRERLPFIGINTGHRGFLLSGAADFAAGWPSGPLVVRQAPLLHVEAVAPGGRVTTGVLAFNDAWVERCTGQTAWVEVRVGGEIRIPRLMGDGILLATAAGSTAYARAMGATPVLFETPALVLVGSNVLEPPGWKAVMLALDSQVVFRALEPVKRPVTAYADGVPLGETAELRLRTSRIATAELAFSPAHDMAEKIAQIQFPPVA